MNLKAVVPLVAGLGIGGFALKMGIDTLRKARAAPTATAQVWAARATIPRGSSITTEMVQALAFPANLVPPGAIKQADQVVGRVPRIDAPAGLPILEEMLLPPGSPAGVHVPKGLRAVAVKIDEGSGVGFHLQPGDRVDVVGFFTVRNDNRQDTIARTLIENVEVAAVGARLSAATGEGDEKGTRPTREVTLLVPPEKVPILHLSEQRGKIKLSLRGTEDVAESGGPSPVSEEELLGAGRVAQQREKPEPTPAPKLAAAPAPAPVVQPAPQPAVEPPWIVTVWRGKEREQVPFKNPDSRERATEPPDPARTAPRAAPPAGAATTPPKPPENKPEQNTPQKAEEESR